MNRIPVIDMTLTGRNIDRLRREAGMTVRQLQAVFGFSTPQAIYKWQRGDAIHPGQRRGAGFRVRRDRGGHPGFSGQ